MKLLLIFLEYRIVVCHSFLIRPMVTIARIRLQAKGKAHNLFVNILIRLDTENLSLFQIDNNVMILISPILCHMFQKQMC